MLRTPRKILLAMSYKYAGDWQKIYEAVCLGDMPTDEEILDALNNTKSNFLTLADIEYPEYLRQIYRPPFVLYYYGDITLLNNPRKNLSVIGSRSPSETDIGIAQEIIGGLPDDVVIVSGLAAGVDGVAHQAALDNNLKTVAVLGGGIDNCYPSININIYKKIKEEGLLISEYPGSTLPNQSQFPARNRIIAMISKCVLIICGKRISGTFITANYALMYNKYVACVPSRDFKDSVCNLLIKEGAYLIESSDDVKEIMSENLYQGMLNNLFYLRKYICFFLVD